MQQDKRSRLVERASTRKRCERSQQSCNRAPARLLQHNETCVADIQNPKNTPGLPSNLRIRGNFFGHAFFEATNPDPDSNAISMPNIIYTYIYKYMISSAASLFVRIKGAACMATITNSLNNLFSTCRQASPQSQRARHPFRRWT